MYELSCPACNSPSQYDFRDFLLMCPFCSCTFKLDLETGQKEIFGDHFIVGNSASPAQVKELALEWLRRLNHVPDQTEREFFVTDIVGLSIPFWVCSMEVHTVWKGLVKRQHRSRLETTPGGEFLSEQGQFRRSYRWGISARNNICESWGMTRLHEPKEAVQVNWDGFPLDSTFSRGQLMENSATEDKSAYDAREFFEFKFANGLPILGVQVTDQEALRRAKLHVELYHLEMARLNVDYLLDFRTEVEMAGVQLIHLPFWHARYVYRPRTALRYVFKPRERNVIIDGYNNGILKGELALHHKDKMWVNSGVCAVAALAFVVLGLTWHPAFLLVALFAAVIAGGSAYVATIRAAKHDEEGTTIDVSTHSAPKGAGAAKRPAVA
jgi:hypothetical protein